MIAALDDPDTELRVAAAYTLARIDNKRSAPRLIALVRDDAEVSVRDAAAYALGALQGKRARSALRRVLANHDEAAQVRGTAAEHLAWFRPAPKAELIAGLRDETADVRFWCAYAMAIMRVRSTLPTLRLLAARDRARVRGWWSVACEARWAIKTLEGQSVDP